MDFDPDDRELRIQRLARDLAVTQLAPLAAERDRTAAFPERELRALAQHGLLGVNVPATYGGAEAGMVAFSLAMQEIARADASVAVTMAVTNLVADVICRFGSEQQRRTYVPQITSGSAVAASFAVSESQAGSDLAAMTTTAVRTATGWRIDGAKQWITSGDRAGVIVLGAKTNPQAGKKGISAFIVAGGTPGMTAGKPEEKMGQRGSSTVPLVFDRCEVPADALLGKEGEGLPLVYAALEGGRIGIASLALGIGRAALDAATRYAQERVQFGAAIATFQAIQFLLADVATEHDAGHLLTMRAARGKDLGRMVTREAAMAKLFASEAAGRATDAAIQIMGASGYMRKNPVERLARDARVTRIYEGTSEVLRLVIARSLLEQQGKTIPE
ncbi:MAG: acyl-CoA dehydrogenase family protein [Planctomycetes bacterium]|nr:acyl-CoA dehydrogenase family protein [Planctomycetota bacterium]